MEQVEYFSAKKLKMSKSGNRRRNPVTVTLETSNDLRENTFPLSREARSITIKGFISYTSAYELVLKGLRIGDFATTRGSNCSYV